MTFGASSAASTPRDAYTALPPGQAGPSGPPNRGSSSKDGTGGRSGEPGSRGFSAVEAGIPRKLSPASGRRGSEREQAGGGGAVNPPASPPPASSHQASAPLPHTRGNLMDGSIRWPPFNQPPPTPLSSDTGPVVSDIPLENSPEWQQVQGLRGEALRNSVAWVNRSFENGNNMQNLGALSGAQKAALMYDMIDGRASAYATELWFWKQQIVLKIYDNVQAMLQNAIGTLQKDPDVQSYLATTIPVAMKRILYTPAHAQLLGQLINDYRTMIVQGGLLNKYDEPEVPAAMRVYLKTAGDLAAVIPDWIIGAGASQAQSTLSNYEIEVGVGDPTLTYLGTRLGIPGYARNERLIEAATNPVVQPSVSAAADGIAAKLGINDPEFKTEIANMLLRLVNGGLSQLRNHYGYTSALYDLQTEGWNEIANTGGTWTNFLKNKPPGYGIGAFKTGMLHAAGAILGGAVYASGIVAGVKGTLTRGQVAGFIAQGASLMSMVAIGVAKSLDPNNMFGSIFTTGDDRTSPWREAIRKYISDEDLANATADVQDVSNTVMGATGLIGAGIGFFSAYQSFRSGDVANGVLNTVSSLANTMGSTEAVIEGGLEVTGTMGEFNGLLARAGITAASESEEIAAAAARAALASVGRTLGVIGYAASIALTIYDIVEEVRQQQKVRHDTNVQLGRLIASAGLG